jgi:alpha-beta hydrolase superfamily lysophospholipase
MSSLPTVILVHGAWHTPPNYKSYADALRIQGFKVHCPHLPTCSGTSPPTASLADDVAHVQKIVQSTVEAGEHVLMIMHSYGGAVGTGAVEGLSLSDRRAAGLAGGVIHLLYLCAYILAPGSTIWEIVQEAGFDKLWDLYIDTAPDGSTAIKDPGLGFFSGNADQAVIDKALRTLVRFPSSVFYEKTIGSAWQTVPTTYISTLKDYAVPKSYQDIMLAKVRSQGAEVKVEEYDADHSLFITMQSDMVRTALKAAVDERNSI